MPRFLGPAMLPLLFLGCGDGGGDSYTAKALDEYRAGKTFDYAPKGKRPSAKEVASYEKKTKSFKAGSKNDMFQALWLLSNQREHEELHFNTIATSTYMRDSYTRVFGPPDESDTKSKTHTWSHQCIDGKVTLHGFLKVKDDPKTMTTLPHKPNAKGGKGE